MPEHVHRWLRYDDPAWNHWCVDGDTTHHPEPCDDATNHTGDHANDTTTQDQWPVLRLA